jgi:ABC-type amino acid transport substrate-binding protein
VILQLSIIYFATTGIVENEGYAVVLPKSSSLTHEVNKILKQMEESGELYKLRSKWGLND